MRVAPTATLLVALLAGRAEAQTASNRCNAINNGTFVQTYMIGGTSIRTRSTLLSSHNVLRTEGDTSGATVPTCMNNHRLGTYSASCFGRDYVQVLETHIPGLLASGSFSKSGTTYLTPVPAATYFTRIPGSESSWGTVLLDVPVYMSCDCGYALARVTGRFYDWMCVYVFTYSGCPAGFQDTDPSPAASACAACVAGSTFNAIYGGTCQACGGCGAGQWRDFCRPHERDACRTCTAACVSTGGYVASTDYAACGPTAAYDYDACGQYLYRYGSCGYVEQAGTAYGPGLVGVAGRISDNACLPMDSFLAWVHAQALCVPDSAIFIFSDGSYQCRARTWLFQSQFTGSWQPPVFPDSTYYIGEVDGYRLRVGRCDARDPRDFAPAGRYHAECAGRASQGLVGLGDERPCNTIANQRPASALSQPRQFVEACGDATSGPAYADCAAAGTQCPAGSFQVACGFHHSEAQVAWGLDANGEPLQDWPLGLARPGDTDIGPWSIGSVSYKGSCVSCRAWAPRACGGNEELVLTACGEGPETVHPETWEGAGMCVECGDAPTVIAFCSESFQAAHAVSGGAAWYSSACRGQNYLEPGDLDCFFCDAARCPSEETLQNCGGENEGSCTACTVSVEVRSGVRDSPNVVFFSQYDGHECLWRCIHGTTGVNCDLPCVEAACAADRFATTCGQYPPHCEACLNVVAGARTGGGAVAGSLLAAADFDEFIFLSLAGSPVDELVFPNAGGVLRYIGGSGVAPLFGLHTDREVHVVRCEQDEEQGSAHWPRVCREAVVAQGGDVVREDGYLRVLNPGLYPGALLQWRTDPYPRNRALLLLLWTRANAIVSAPIDVRVGASDLDLTHSLSASAPVSLTWALWRLLLSPRTVTQALPGAVAWQHETIPYSGSVLRLWVFGAAQFDVDEVLLAPVAVAITHEEADHQLQALDDPLWYAAHSAGATLVFLGDFGVARDGYGAQGLHMAAGATVTLAGGWPDTLVSWLTFECDVWTLGASVLVRVVSRRGGRELRQADVAVTHVPGVWQRVATSFSTAGWAPSDTLVELQVSGGAVIADNLLLWEKPRTCPWACPAGARREGEACVSCAALRDTAPRPLCTPQARYADCTQDGYTPEIRCTACEPPPPPNAAFVAHATAECHWECAAGFYRAGAECLPCSAVTTCPVGQFVSVCTPERDTLCAPCTTIAREVTANAGRARYTTAGSAPGADDCAYECDLGAGFYLFGTDCLPCSRPVCGGVGWFQRRLSCQQGRDAQCAPCAAPAENAVVVASAPQADAPCVEACLPGYALCAPCPPHTLGDADLVISGSLEAQFFPTLVFTAINGVPFSLDLGSTGVRFQALNARTIIPDASMDGVRCRRHFVADFMYVTLAFTLAEYADVAVRVTYRQWVSSGTAAPNGAALVRVRRAGGSVLHEEPTTFASVLSVFERGLGVLSPGTYEVTFDVPPNNPTATILQLTLSEARIHVHNLGACGVCGDFTGCVPCDATDVPENADLVPVRLPDGAFRCEWACRAGYRNRGTWCEYCPVQACTLGWYQTDCYVCSPCSVPAAYAGTTVFTGGGATPFVDSCPYECAPGRYDVPGEGCLPCAAPTCAAGQYLQACSRQTDAVCRNCSAACAPGSFVTSPCGAAADLACAPCPGALPADAAWTAACAWACDAGFVLNTDTGLCQRCLPRCAAGEFVTECAATNAWTGCAPCALPPGALAVSAGVGDERSCLWACPPATVEARLANGTLVCRAADSVVRPPETCVAIPCVPGRVLNRSTCACEPCPGALPAHAVWLSEFLTRRPCVWACLAPRTPSAARDACVQLDELFPGDTTPPPPTTPRPGADPGPLVRGAALAPILLISAAVAAVVACVRGTASLRARIRFLPATVRAARERARAALARLGRRREKAVT
jgi:hypothetical protein